MFVRHIYGRRCRLNMSDPNITLGQIRTDFSLAHLFPTVFPLQFHLAVFGVMYRRMCACLFYLCPCCFNASKTMSLLHTHTQTHSPVSERGCDNNLFTKTNPYNKLWASPSVLKHNCAFISSTDTLTHATTRDT